MRRNPAIQATSPPFSSSYATDADDNLESLTYPTGRVVQYHYDGENRLTSLDQTPPGTQTSAVFAHDFGYGDEGRLASYVTGAVTHGFTYEANRPKHVFTTGGAGALDLFYSYDNVGNVTAIADPRPNATQTFVPDPLDRLGTAAGPWGTLQWTYDAAGNRLTETDGTATTTSVIHGPTQRLLSTAGAATETFTYDNVGQLTSDAVISQYTYSPAGKLTGATGSGATASYGYDAAGERFSKTVNGQTTYAIRSLAGQTLSEYLESCGATIWSRDLVYAGGQLIGAVKAVTTQPTVAMAAATASVCEGVGTVSVRVRLTTPNGAPLGCGVSVHYATTAGTATEGADYTAVSGTVTFPSGAASGSTQAIAIPIGVDGVHEATETLSVALSSAAGATIGTPGATTVTIVDVPPRADFDGDRHADLTVWRGVNGTWYWVTSSSGYNYANAAQHPWGDQSLGDVPLVADIDGDGKSDLVVWRATTGTWYWLTSSSGYAAGGSRPWGSVGDRPLTADIDGGGKSDFVVWRASTGTWYWTTSSSGYTAGDSRVWGDQSLGDVPLVADVDGDGKSDLVVWRATTGTWYWLTSASGYTQGGSQVWGDQTQGDVPVVADIDGDGHADLVVWRGSSGTWHWRTSSSGYTEAGEKQWGNQSAGDQPLVCDIDGDGKSDLVVWRGSTGTWYWLTSSSGYSYAAQGQKQWGSQSYGDIPLPGPGGGA